MSRGGTTGARWEGCLEKGAWTQAALGGGTEPTHHCWAQEMCLGRGWRGVLAARQASVLPAGQGMASGVAFCHPSKRREELLWPPVNSPPALVWPQCLQTAGLTQHPCIGHSQCRMDPGGEHQDGSWGEHPRRPWIPMFSSVLGYQQYRDKTGTISRDPGCPVSAGTGTYFG